jgi:hypothetical protein
LPFSRRKRIDQTFQNANDLGAQRSAGTAGWAGWPLTLTCFGHERTTPAHDHAGITDIRWNHLKHTITPSTTGKKHHG